MAGVSLPHLMSLALLAHMAHLSDLHAASFDFLRVLLAENFEQQRNTADSAAFALLTVCPVRCLLCIHLAHSMVNILYSRARCSCMLHPAIHRTTLEGVGETWQCVRVYDTLACDVCVCPGAQMIDAGEIDEPALSPHVLSAAAACYRSLGDERHAWSTPHVDTATFAEWVLARLELGGLSELSRDRLRRELGSENYKRLVECKHALRSTASGWANTHLEWRATKLRLSRRQGSASTIWSRSGPGLAEPLAGVAGARPPPKRVSWRARQMRCGGRFLPSIGLRSEWRLMMRFPKTCEAVLARWRDKTDAGR